MMAFRMCMVSPVLRTLYMEVLIHRTVSLLVLVRAVGSEVAASSSTHFDLADAAGVARFPQAIALLRVRLCLCLSCRLWLAIYLHARSPLKAVVDAWECASCAPIAGTRPWVVRVGVGTVALNSEMLGSFITASSRAYMRQARIRCWIRICHLELIATRLSGELRQMWVAVVGGDTWDELHEG